MCSFALRLLVTAAASSLVAEQVDAFSAANSPPRAPFPRTKYGDDRQKTLQSDGFAKAIQFLEKVHQERYSTYGNCEILGPAWKEFDDKGPLLPPNPLLNVKESENDDDIESTPYSRDQQRSDVVSPLSSSTSQLSAEFASIAAKKKKGSTTANSNKGFGSSNTDKAAGSGFGSSKKQTNGRGRKTKKWSSDTKDGSSRKRSKWSSHDDVSGSNAALSSDTQSTHSEDIDNKPFLTCPSLFDGNFCAVTNRPIFTPEECQLIIDEAANDDGTPDVWKSHDQYYKSMKITRRIADMPKTRELFGRACIERIFPLLQRMYPTACPQGSNGLRDFRIFTAKVLRYDAASGNDYLGVHHDGSLLTFLIALNDLDEYEGGGTYMEALGEAIRYEAGHLCCHPGIVRHGGNKVTKGTRYVLAAWIDIHNVIEYDRQLCEEADLTRMSGRLDQTIQYDIGDDRISGGKADKRLEKAEQFYLYSLAAGETYGRQAEVSTDLINENLSTVPPLTSENAWLGLGQLWLDQGKSIEAADAFRNAIDLSPYNTRAWNSYGLALIDLNDIDGAMHALKIASDLNEYEFDALSNLGLLLSMQEKHQEAVETYEKAVGRIQQGSDGSIKADKRSAAELYTNYGVTLCDLLRFQEAMVVFAKAVVIDPSFHDAARNLRAVKDALA